jgi:hypothetical protein
MQVQISRATGGSIRRHHRGVWLGHLPSWSQRLGYHRQPGLGCYWHPDSWNPADASCGYLGGRSRGVGYPPKNPVLGPDELMLAAKIEVKAGASGKDTSRHIDSAEALVRKVVPETRIIYLEPKYQRVSVSG